MKIFEFPLEYNDKLIISELQKEYFMGNTISIKSLQQKFACKNCKTVEGVGFWKVHPIGSHVNGKLKKIRITKTFKKRPRGLDILPDLLLDETSIALWIMAM